ncbi:hypothetical protein F0562_034321 [Nyssa sinensis]|uniref:Pre-mRNA-processing factor 17 n=1 Tax=Nyssa sinensis TaxID=561372 RepID=A0A5J5AH77_9ASTE|nr:hypothetical protein F0562_034321 [Nyssa sinensis]
MLTLTIANSNRALTKPLDPSQYVVTFNPTYDQLWAPIYGPAHPYAKDGIAQGMWNHKLGFVENAAIEPFIFYEEYNTFHKYRYAANPSTAAGNNYKRDLDVLRQNDGISVGKKEGLQIELTEEQKKYAEEYAKKKGGNEKGEFVADKSTFHGKEERDYPGRSCITPLKDAKARNDHCYILKRLVHTWGGHTKGVSVIRFFPKYGHLILSARMDTKVKIWDVFNSGKCMRTYMGNSKAVRDISFCNDGSKFLTAGYDKNIKYWDTEIEQVISTFSTGKIPYIVRLNPDEDKQNILLAGMSDKKIVQWDMNTRQITQEYDQHLGAVNTITFVDNNRRFFTFNNDKSLRIWEFGILVVIKYISEPHMHSMSSISLHPNTNWLAAPSLDNQILIYSTRERFQLNKKKRFAGHIAAGYACQVNFSPDGHFVMSGDGEGKCWFWDWKSCKVFRTLKCHKGFAFEIQFLPHQIPPICGTSLSLELQASITAHSSPIPFVSIADCHTCSPLGGGDNNGIGKKGSRVLLKGMRYSELEKWVQSHGYRPGQALMLWKHLYGNNIWAHCIDELEGLNKDFKKMLSEHANFKALSLKDIHTASDGTRKEVADFIHIGRWTSNRNSCYTLSKG